MPEIKAKPAFHQEQVPIVDYTYRCPLHFSTFILKCLKTSVESCRVSPWNFGIKDIHIGQDVMCLAKKPCSLLRCFGRLP